MINYTILDTSTNRISDLKNVIGDFPQFNFVECSIEASTIINSFLENNIELVFINIDINSVDFKATFNKIKKSSIKVPLLIAMSKVKKQAYSAYKMGFTDFILLPVNKDEVIKSINNLKEVMLFSNENDLICLKSYKDFQYVKLNAIEYLKADNNTTDFFLGNGEKISAYKTLKAFEQSLPKNFVRIHRSFMVNLDFVSRIQIGKNTCTVKNLKEELPFSKSYVNNVKKIVLLLNKNSIHI